jgi:hypothetical protein
MRGRLIDLVLFASDRARVAVLALVALLLVRLAAGLAGAA